MIPSKIRGFRSRVINALIDCVRTQRPIAGNGVKLQRTQNGTIITATATGEVAITQAEAKILPLTIRQFAVTTETSSGTTTENKVGIYIPNTFAALLYAIDETGTTSLGLAWSTKLLLVDGYNSVDAEHPLWRDITSSVSAAGEDPLYIAADIQANGDICELTIGLRDTADPIADATGWAVPLATIQRVNNGHDFSISQFRFGPLLESKHLIGCRLVKTTKTPYASGFDPLTDWTPVAEGETLSASYKYYLEGQTHLRLSYAENTGSRETLSTTRHQDTWLENTIHIQVKPIAFANFGSILS